MGLDDGVLMRVWGWECPKDGTKDIVWSLLETDYFDILYKGGVHGFTKGKAHENYLS